MNTGDELPALTYTTGKGEGLNLLGNPFPSSVDWDLCEKTAGINAAVYVYDGDAGQYISWNGTTGSLLDGIIPNMQGFFVKVDDNSQTLTLPNSARVHSDMNFYKNQQEVENLLVLQINGNGFSDKTYFNINNNATFGFDNQYDAYKLFGINEAPQLYSILPGKKLSINVFPHPTNIAYIPLGLRVGENTQYSINISENNMADSISLILEDLKEGISVSLDSISYTFSAATTDNTNRFKLHFMLSTDIQEGITQDPFTVYSENNNIHIVSYHQSIKNTGVQIFNLLGQQVLPQQRLAGNHTIINACNNSGILIVRIIHNNNFINKKILLR